ncbi:uncharacterized protein LOC143834353 [Paroedura picta]|uniref:uncharacterized protein LOC143834353 n=1 Tax=Paroedura picta TaxID=143630 RepID=UPI004056D155
MSFGAKSESGKTLDYNRRDRHYPYVHLGDPHTNPPPHPHAHLRDQHTSHPPLPHPPPRAHLGFPHHTHLRHPPHAHLRDPPLPPPPHLRDLPLGLNPQMTLAPNKAEEGWATSQLLKQPWAVPCQDDQNTMLPLQWPQRNPSSTKTLLRDDANTLQRMGTMDPSSWSGAQSVSETLPDYSGLTLELWQSSVSGAEPGGSLEEGIGLVGKVGEFEERHFFGAPGRGEEGMAFQRYESQEVSESQQRPEDWWPSGPMRTDSLLDDQVLTEAAFSRKEPSSGTECEENLGQRSDPSGSQPAKKENFMYPCSENGESSVNESFLLKQEEAHEEETPYTCLRCGKSFSNSYHLMVHLDGHTGENPFCCLECDESFFWESQLLAHSTKHSQDKPFQCLECGVVFCWAMCLWAHIKSRHRKKPQASMLN